MPTDKWSRLPLEDVIKKLKTNTTRGLSADEAERRRGLVGDNVFTAGARHGVLYKVWEQLKSPLVFILLIAGVATLFLGAYLDAIVITIALVVNIAIGVFQEERAGRAFDKLSESQERRATVIRNNKRHVIPAESLVPGDVVILESGSYVPADIRLVDETDLEVNEAALTGEWVAVKKEVGEVGANTPLSERTNMAWMGTLVAGGFGVGVVVATGNRTQIGSVAEELGSMETVKTPIQKSVSRLAVFLSYLVLAVVATIFVVGLVRGQELGEMLLLAIAVAVSVIPQGLPAAVAAVLAIGMEKILNRGGLVRNLLAAETLGSTTTILTDKTGTLTEAKMHVADIVARTDERVALTAAALASEAFLEEGDDGALVARGRPMEKAILMKGVEVGVSQEDLRSEYTELDFLAFSSQHGFSASLNVVPDASKARLHILGVPEMLIEEADNVFVDGEVVPFDDDVREEFEEKLRSHAAEGSRVVGVAVRDVSWEAFPDKKKKVKAALEKSTFVGLVIFEDPVRKDVHESIARVKDAGAHVLMLTGDNPETARYVAVKTGIAEQGEEVLVGSDIDNLSDEELLKKLKQTHIVARVAPDQKLRIANALRNAGEVIAMTGDGINDAPALQSADIGVAVGSGTEVAREASDLVLLGDSFSIIVAAIEEGRRIIDNLKKVITHLLSTSFHEVALIAAAIGFGLPLPVLPVQILWVNILEEGLLSFGFAFEPPEPDVMKRNPRSDRIKNILTKPVRKLILISGIITAAFSLTIFLLLLNSSLPIEEVRTIVFVMLTFDSIFFALSLKHLRKPFWTTNLLSNKYLLLALGISVVLLVATLTLPPLRTLLSLVPLSLTDVLILVGVAAFNLLTIETTKYFVFRRHSDA